MVTWERNHWTEGSAKPTFENRSKGINQEFQAAWAVHWHSCWKGQTAAVDDIARVEEEKKGNGISLEEFQEGRGPYLWNVDTNTHVRKVPAHELYITDFETQGTTSENPAKTKQEETLKKKIHAN